MANDRLNSEQMSKTLSLLEYMLITACKHSKEGMVEIVESYGKQKYPRQEETGKADSKNHPATPSTSP
jgi:hypothetical protein